MSIQVGTINLTNYRSIKDQLILTTTSNHPLIHIDTRHPTSNAFLRTKDYFLGQSNASFYLGIGSQQPILEFHSNQNHLHLASNLMGSNITATFQNLAILQNTHLATLNSSNLTVEYNPDTGPVPTVLFKNNYSNLFVLNGYDDIAYFTGRLGIGTTQPKAAFHAPTGDLDALTIDTLSFDGTAGIYLSNVLGSIHATKPTVFEGNVDVIGGLSAGSFDIVDLSTNRGVFRSNVRIQDALEVVHTSNQAPTVHLQRRYLSCNAEHFSNVSEWQPILSTTMVTESNTTFQTTSILTIDPTGKIGIGTTTPTKLLDIHLGNTFASTVSNTGIFGIQGNYPTDHLCINCNAFVGIGTATPQCYLDLQVPAPEAFASNGAPGYFYVHSNETPLLFMDSNGHLALHSTTTRSNAILYVDGVAEIEYLAPHRIITPDDTPTIFFSDCNIGSIRTISASNINIDIISASNIYCDLITASNYDLLAFNSYLATQELELELDDLIYTGNNAFILSRHYPLYFDTIGASNPLGNLEGTSDSNLENKPTDHLNYPIFGRAHIVSDSVSNAVLLPTVAGLTRPYNNALVSTSSNVFTGVDCNVAVFLHTQGQLGSGYTFGVSQPTYQNDALVRWSLDPYPFDDVAYTTYGMDTVAMTMTPYNNPNGRRYGCRFNYTYNLFQLPRVYVSGPNITATIPTSELTASTGINLYSRGDVKADASGGAATMYCARYNSGNTTFAIGSNIESPTGHLLDVNGRCMLRNDVQVIGKIYANSVISQTSDRRLKEDVCLITDPLEKINQLSGYTFQRIDTQQRETGLMAQEVQAVLPEVVHSNTDGYYSIAYGNLAGLFVESIKALQSRIADLEATVQSLKKNSD